MEDSNKKVQEYEDAIKEIDNQLQLVSDNIDKLYNDQDILNEERDRYQDLLDEILFKDYELKVNTCYLYYNPNPSWHDDIYNIIKILEYRNNFVKYINYIYRTDDGDESFFIKVKTDNKIHFLRELREGNFEIIDLKKAEEIVKSKSYLN